MPDDPNEKSEKSAEKIDAPHGEVAGKGEVVATEPKAEPAKIEAADDEEEDAAGPEEDAFRPEAIAKRIDKIGEETDLDRLARAEELKLAARKKELKKKGKKGLESAASKKLAKIGERAVKRPSSVATASDIGDPLLERTAKLGSWAKKNQRVFSILIGAVIVGLAGFGGYTVWQKKKAANASMVLAEAVADENGKIGEPSKDDSELRPTFKTTEERRDAALAKYRDVQKMYPSSGAAVFGRLGEATLLLDMKDAEQAISAFNDVKASPLGQADGQVRGRALEGLGFAYEMKAELVPAERDKQLDLALKAFKELQVVEMKGFKELGMYHEARVQDAKGDPAEAAKILTEVEKRISKAVETTGEVHPFPYLENAVADRLRLLPGGRGAVGSREQRRAHAEDKAREAQRTKAIERMIEAQKKKGPRPAPITPPPPPPQSASPAPAPAPAPENK